MADRPDPDATPDREPTLSEAFAEATQRSGLGHVRPGEAPTASALLGAMGGVRGLIESILPGFVFLIVFTITQQVLPSVIAPAIIGVAFIVARAAQRQPVLTAVAGLIGIAISATLALLTGNASNNFVPGIVINAVIVVVMVISIAARWPFVGLVVGGLTGDVTAWRDDRAKVRVAVIATWLWAGLSALRVAVQLPLYLADQTQALGATKLVMGIPFYAGLLWVTWLLVRTAWATDDEPSGRAKVS